MTSQAPALIALVDDAPDPGGGVTLRSPAVGILKDVPAPGHVLGPGRPFASLRILDRAHPLLVPEGVAGVVIEVGVEGSGADALPVEYGQPILTLAPLGGPVAGAGARVPAMAARAGAARTGAAHAEPIPAGCHAVLSPADGVFYRSPRPTEPAYVEPGSRVHAGQTLALIEAMKCFSAITYGGLGLPEQAEVVEVRAADASEVRHGQVLFVVR